jgi:glycine/D-amino acid oxidase-like deaminating enzyme
MSIQVPEKIKYLVVGAGVHGLSSGWHLAKELKARGRGSGEDVIIVDKTTIASGASGIACGVIRNFYFQPAMGEVIRVSVEVWESDPEAFCYNNVGYMALVSDVQAEDLDVIYERQQRGGYKSSLICGEQDVFNYMRRLFPDWKARNLTRCLHEHQGGFAWNSPAMFGLARKAEAEGGAHP